jgi:type II secretory pathway pseudopilin PulG
MRATCNNSTRRHLSAYTLVEVLVAATVVGLMVVSLYTAFSAGFAVLKASREKSRATQIVLQKLEALRFCTWSQLNHFPQQFHEPFDPTVTNSAGNAFYFGSVSFTPASVIPDTAPYKTNMQQVTVSVWWTNFDRNIPRPQSEQMTILVGRYGAQNYALGK